MVSVLQEGDEFPHLLHLPTIHKFYNSGPVVPSSQLQLHKQINIPV